MPTHKKHFRFALDDYNQWVLTEGKRVKITIRALFVATDQQMLTRTIRVHGLPLSEQEQQTYLDKIEKHYNGKE